MNLLPKPQKLEVKDGFLKNKSMNIINRCTDIRIQKALEKLVCDKEGTVLEISDKGGTVESYSLMIEADKVTLIGESAAGVFYGIQTLRQILEHDKVPCLVIEDYAGLEHRGFYHDITRGKVPTVDTLKELIDQMAYYKMNSLQLYVEHTFPFKELGNFVEETGYLTAEEIKELDDYCYENFIEFIPSIATFGHLYELLELEEFRELRELPDFVEDQHFWPQRMGHHTIDPTNERSFEIIKSLLDQYMPLFRSNKFNICCDETFDLKKGRHKGQDTGRLYIDFVKKIIGYLESKGKKVMMWADILLKHPETIGELPEGIEYLNWHYAKNPIDASFAHFEKLNCTQISCPGTHSWSRLIECLDNSVPNILMMGDYAYDYHAKGMLNTNWGDYGNPCSLELAMYGTVLGAAKAWNRETKADTYFNDSINYLLYKHTDAVIYLMELDQIHSKIDWNNFTYCYSNCIYEKQFENIKKMPSETQISEIQKECQEFMAKLGNQVWTNDEFRQEMLLTAEGILVMTELYAKYAGYACERCSDTEHFLAKYREKWIQKNKESELYEIEKMFRTLEMA